jgi:hypothetical protein
MDMWRWYFGPDAMLFGIDIDPKCAEFDGQSGQIRIGSQDDPDFLRSVVREMGGLDIVIDDGSHDSIHIRKSLDTLFPDLSDDGVYFIEDLHAAYWHSYSGGYRARTSFLEAAKEMIDDMHHWYHDNGLTVASTAGCVGGIHIHDSIVVLEKAGDLPPRRTFRTQT